MEILWGQVLFVLKIYNFNPFIIRLFDFFVACSLLFVLSPLLISISSILMITGERRVIYKQKRIGRGGRPFDVYKFATMLENSPNIGAKDVTVENDPRVLPVGRILRSTKLNELPQLFNVVNGTMSFVGPRPLVENTYNYYSKDQKDIIASVLPGITGLGSLYFRNEEVFFKRASDAVKLYKNFIAPRKAFLECWYVENYSFITYLKIFFFTFFVVVMPRFSRSSINFFLSDEEIKTFDDL